MESSELTEALHSGKLKEAAAKLEQEREAARVCGDLRASATAGNDLGVVCYLEGLAPQARQALEGARDEFIRLNDPVGQARSLGNLARLEEKERNRVAALAMYRQAVDLLDQANERSDEFVTLRSLSQLYLKMGGWIQALAAYDRALTIKPQSTLFDALLHWLYQIPLRMLGIEPV